MQFTPLSSQTYRIIPEVPPSYYEKLFTFIYTQYLLAQKQRFTDITRESTSQGEKLLYTVTDSQGTSIAMVELKSGKQFELKISPLTSVNSHNVVEEAKQDVLTRENHKSKQKKPHHDQTTF